MNVYQYNQIRVSIQAEMQVLNETTNLIVKVISEEEVLLQQDRILRRRSISQKVDDEDSYQMYSIQIAL